MKISFETSPTGTWVRSYQQKRQLVLAATTSIMRYAQSSVTGVQSVNRKACWESSQACLFPALCSAHHFPSPLPRRTSLSLFVRQETGLLCPRNCATGKIRTSPSPASPASGWSANVVKLETAGIHNKMQIFLLLPTLNFRTKMF